MRHLSEAFAEGFANAFEDVGAGLTKFFFSGGGDS